MNQTPNTCPLTNFREFVAQRLHTAPFGWGSCGYELERRYYDLVQEYWADGETVDDTAAAVHKLHMSRPVQKVEQMTRKSLSAAGCTFADDVEYEWRRDERSERQGDLIAMYRAEY
jgi:hypothetical protein